MRPPDSPIPIDLLHAFRPSPRNFPRSVLRPLHALTATRSSQEGLAYKFSYSVARNGRGEGGKGQITESVSWFPFRSYFHFKYSRVPNLNAAPSRHQPLSAAISDPHIYSQRMHGLDALCLMGAIIRRRLAARTRRAAAVHEWRLNLTSPKL